MYLEAFLNVLSDLFPRWQLNSIIRICCECKGGIENKLSWGSLIGITRLAEWWQMVTVRDGFFYPILTWIMDSFSCSKLNTSFLLEKHEKISRKSWNAEIRHVEVILTLQWRHRSTCSHEAVPFYLSHGLVRVKTTEIPIWCASNNCLIIVARMLILISCTFFYNHTSNNLTVHSNETSVNNITLSSRCLPNNI